MKVENFEILVAKKNIDFPKQEKKCCVISHFFVHKFGSLSWRHLHSTHELCLCMVQSNFLHYRKLVCKSLVSKEIKPKRNKFYKGYDKKICLKEGKSATLTWFTSVDIYVAYRFRWKYKGSFQPTLTFFSCRSSWWKLPLYFHRNLYAVYRCESGRWRTLPLFLTYFLFYNFTFSGFYFILIFAMVITLLTIKHEERFHIYIYRRKDPCHKLASQLHSHKKGRLCQSKK